MLILDDPANQQPIKTLKQWRQLLWNSIESLLKKLLTPYKLVHTIQFFRCFECETWGISITQDLLNDIYNDPDHNWWRNKTCGYNVDIKDQSSQWRLSADPRLKNRHQVRLQWRGAIWVLVRNSYSEQGIIFRQKNIEIMSKPSSN